MPVDLRETKKEKETKWISQARDLEILLEFRGVLLD